MSRFRDIPQSRILENYADSIHGEGLYQKGLTVTAVCTSCHTAHLILPHTDPRSSISAGRVVATCTQCHGQIEQVHRKVIEGRLWEEAPHKIPVCVDCHEPHKIRKVYYTAGMANTDCLSCHADRERMVGAASAAGGREGGEATQGAGTAHAGNAAGVPHAGEAAVVPQTGAAHAGGAGPTEDHGKVIGGAADRLYVDPDAYAASAHAGTACAQCHTEVAPSKVRACETIRSPVDCSICHAAQVDQYRTSIHGTLSAKGDPDAPVCLDCHNPHATQKKTSPASPTFARNVPLLCARCHRVGERAAVRIKIGVPDIVGSYIDSIHGKGLLESGLTVTATCVNCHSSHGELPPSDPRSTVNPAHIADTCGTCHDGIEETFKTSIHSHRHAHRRPPAAHLRGLPHLAHHQPHRRPRLPHRDDGAVRALPRGRGGDVLRHLPRQGLAAGFGGRRQVLRLPRHPRHPAAVRPRLPSQPPERRRHLRQVPRRFAPPLRRLPDPRHPPRPEEVPVAVLGLLGDDRAADRHPRLRPAPHPGVAEPAVAEPRRVAGAQAGAAVRSSAALPALHPPPARPPHRHDAELLHPGADRHDAEVLVRRRGRGRCRGCSAASPPWPSSTGWGR